MPKITAIGDSGHEPRPSNYSTGFLKFGTVDIWGQIVFGLGELFCALWDV